MKESYSVSLDINHETDVPDLANTTACSTIQFSIVIHASDAREALNQAIGAACWVYSIDSQSHWTVGKIDIMLSDEREMS